MTRLLSLLLVLVAMAAIGCYSTETEATTENGSSVSNDTDMSTTSDVEMAVCEGCGAEVPQDMLADHEGMMLCPDCVKMHDADGLTCSSCGATIAEGDVVMKDGEPFCEDCAS